MTRRGRLQPCVYVVAARDYRVKIGVSALLSRRMAQLVALEGEPLAVIQRFDFPTMRLAFRVELAAKVALQDHRIEGEWFRVARDAAVEAVEQAAALAISAVDVAEAVGPAERVQAALSEDIASIVAARRMLDWTQDELAARAGISVGTLKNIERGTADARIGTLNAIRGALSAGGVIFLQPGAVHAGGRGVRFKA